MDGEKGELRFQFDEFRHAAVDFDDPGEVAAFDRKQGSSAQRDNALLDRLGAEDGQTLIDLGCGTGHFACQAALRCRQVHAVDISLPMIEFGRRRADEMKLANLEFHQAGFLTYEHAGAQADFVTTKSALHHLPDFWKVAALRRIADLLKPGGILYLWDVVYSFPPECYEREVRRWIDAVGRDDGMGFSREEFAAHVREEFSIYDWLMDQMLTKTGFRVVEKTLPGNTYAEYVCVLEGRP